MSRFDRLAAEWARRSKRQAFTPEALCAGVPPQLRAVLSKAKRKVLKCGRRAGKTFGVDVAMLEAAKGDLATAVATAVLGWQCLYVTLTRANAKEIAWADLLRLNDEHALGGQVNLTDLSMRFPGGGLIQLRGANNEREVAKIRGKKFHLVIIDEAQSIPDRILRPLVTDVIGPTLLDYGGTLWLVGTPPPVRAGYFWECYAGALKDRWEQHHWTVRDNAMLPARLAGRSVDDILAEVRAENGWTEDHPTYRREFLGEDVEDLQALLFEFSAERNAWTALPEGAWSYVIGVDIGFDDSDAIAVLGWQAHDRRVFLLEEHTAAGQDVTDLAERLRPLITKLNPLRVVIDQGGLGKKVAAELTRRHNIPLAGAEKQRKGEFIKLLNADLRKGKLLAPGDGVFAEDCKLVRKDPEALAKGLLQELPSAKGGYHSDICDAVLYGWRECLAVFEQEAPPPPPPPGDALKAARLERAARDAREPWEQRAARRAGFE